MARDTRDNSNCTNSDWSKKNTRIQQVNCEGDKRFCKGKRTNQKEDTRRTQALRGGDISTNKDRRRQKRR